MARLRIANPFPAICILAAALLPVACRPGGAPSQGAADKVVRSLESESDALARAFGPLMW